MEIASQLEYVRGDGKPLNPNDCVGVGHKYATVADIPDGLKYKNKLITDADNSVTWQCYLDTDGTTWKKRIYDGVFFVDVLCMDTTPGESHGGEYFYGAMEEDGYTCSTSNVALVVNCATPHMNGVWIINTTGAWARHPLFDEDADNIKNITFVSKNGTVYSGSKWVFTTNGALTIKSTIAEAGTGTWLDFEQVTPTKNYESQTVTSGTTINRFKRHTSVNCTSGNIEIGIGAQIFPNVEYLITKIDSTDNQVRIARMVGDVITEHVLIDTGDWVRFVNYGEKLGGAYRFISNRINKVITPTDISSNGKLSLDIPHGNIFYSITTTVSGTANDAGITINLGTTAAGNDIAQSLSLSEDTPLTTVINRKDIKEVYVSSSAWAGGTIEISMLVVQYSTNASLIGDATNNTSFDSTGHQTMAGTAKPWEDLRIEPNVRTGTPAGGIPTFEKYFDDSAGTSKGVYLYSFTDEVSAANEKEVFFTAQMPHAWDGGDISTHVHFVPAATVNATDIVWGLEYAFKDIGEVFGDTTIITSSTTLFPDDANITAGKHYIAEFTDITPGATQNGLSAIMIGRLFRNSSSGTDTYTNKVGLLYIDIHYQMNSLGSTDEYSK